MASFTLFELLAEMVHEEHIRRIAEATHDIAEKGYDYVQAISVVGGADDPHAGDFKRYWSVRDYPPRHEGDMPMSQVRNDDPGAVSIEYGTHNTPPHPLMAQARAFIDKLIEKDIHI